MKKDKTPVFTSESTSLSDILLLLAEQLKLIITIPAILVFLSFTYIQFIQKPIYESSATVLFPENTNSNLGVLLELHHSLELTYHLQRRLIFLVLSFSRVAK